MKSDFKKEQIRGLTIWSIILIIVAIIVVGVVVLSYVLSRETRKESLTNQTPPGAEERSTGVSKTAPKPELFTFRGVITKIEGDEIIVKGEEEGKDKILISKVLKDTIYNYVLMSRVISNDNSKPVLMRKEEKEIIFSDLKEGDRVIINAISLDKGKNVFIADNVQVYEIVE